MNTNKYRSPKRASIDKMHHSFTLIELLVVIAIIAILAAVIMVSTSGARQQARDVRRTQDLDALATALEIYYSDHKAYPQGNIGPNNSDSDYGFCIETAADTNALFTQNLIQGNYISQFPRDPLYNQSQCASPYNTNCRCYIYKTQGNQKFKIFSNVEQNNFEPAKKDGGIRDISYEVYSINQGSNQIAWLSGGYGGGGTGSWPYNKQISLTNYTPSSTLQNYQVEVTVPYVQGMKSDFQDIRFTDKYGVTLPYWLKTKTNSSSATYFVKVNSISPTSDTILVWYGNSSATYAGSYDDTFDKSLKLTATGTTDPNLKGEWLMDEGSGTQVNDTSGNNNNGTSYAKALSFDGANDYVNCGDGVSLKIGEPLTIEVWTKRQPGTPNDVKIVGNYHPNIKGYIMQSYNGNLNFGFSNGSGHINYNFGGDYRDGQWHHFVITKDSNYIRAYIDGNAQTPVNETRLIVPSDYGLGIGVGSNVWTSFPFNGLMDDVRIYNTALSATDVANRYNGIEPSCVNRSTPSTSCLKGEWRFSDVTSTTTQDYSGNGNTGTLVNGPTVTSTWQHPSNTAPWDSQPSTYFTANSSALRFNGINDYVGVADTLQIKYKGEDMTIEAWIYINALENTGGYIISKPWNGDGEYNYRISYGGNRVIQFYLSGNKTMSNSISTATGISSATWHHIVATVNSAKEMKIYVDGTQQASGVHSITSWTPTSGDSNLNLAIGTLYPYGGGWAGNTSYSFNGLIDDVRIYKRVLTANEIKAHYEHRKCAVSSRTDCGVTATVQ